MANYCWAKNKPTFCPLLRLTAFTVSLLLIIFPIKINIRKCSSLQEVLFSRKCRTWKKSQKQHWPLCCWKTWREQLKQKCHPCMQMIQQITDKATKGYINIRRLLCRKMDQVKDLRLQFQLIDFCCLNYSKTSVLPCIWTHSFTYKAECCN